MGVLVCSRVLSLTITDLVHMLSHIKVIRCLVANLTLHTEFYSLKIYIVNINNSNKLLHKKKAFKDNHIKNNIIYIYETKMNKFINDRVQRWNLFFNSVETLGKTSYLSGIFSCIQKWNRCESTNSQVGFNLGNSKNVTEWST